VVVESGTDCDEGCPLVPRYRLVHPGAVGVAAQQASNAVVLGNETVAVESIR